LDLFPDWKDYVLPVGVCVFLVLVATVRIDASIGGTVIAIVAAIVAGIAGVWLYNKIAGE
jgi:hypothetical protein